MPAEEKNKVIYVSHPSGSTAEIALYGIYELNACHLYRVALFIASS